MQCLSTEGLVKSNLFQNDSNKQKSFHLLIRDLHDECSISMSVEVICNLHKESFEKTYMGYFYASSNSRMQRRLQPWWLFGKWLLSLVIKVKVSHPHITPHILSANIYSECEFVSSVLENKLGKNTFLWFS